MTANPRVVCCACESAENSGKCAEAKRREDSAKLNPKGAQASARLGVKLAPTGWSNECLLDYDCALEASGAAGWGGVVLHGTPEVMAQHSVRMSRRIAWLARLCASESPLS